MKKVLLASAVAAAFAAPAAVCNSYAQQAAAPSSPFSYNVGVVTNYLFRGVSQTHGAPAIQGGVDYAHSSGFYLGAWGSSISWVKDFLGKGSFEIDIYGGYKNSFAGGNWNYDVGYISYMYPRHGSAIPTVLADPNTEELYASIGYKWLAAKYSYATSKNFIGWYGGAGLNQDTRGSDYLEFNANYDMGNGLTAIGHWGTQTVKNSVDIPGGVRSASYSDWKLGVSKDVGFGTVTLVYSDTTSNGTCTGVGGTNSYCWANNGFVSGVGPSTGYKNVSRSTAVLSFLKSF